MSLAAVLFGTAFIETLTATVPFAERYVGVPASDIVAVLSRHELVIVVF